MKKLMLLAGLALPALGAVPAKAEHPAECRVAETQIAKTFALARTARAIAAKHLNVLVLGAGSSALPGSDGTRKAYPGRLEAALAEALPGVAVTVASDVKSGRTAREMVGSLTRTLARIKPDLIVWQTGTVDAMRGLDTDSFNQALEQGIGLARSAGADTVLINAQYSPRTESMIALADYAEQMRWVALQQEVPLFDRFGIMRIWADLGTFDFYAATKKLDMAERVHDCIGRLLSDFVMESVKPDGPQAESGR